MLKVKNAFQSLEKHSIQLNLINGYYYESGYTEGDIEELRNTLTVLNEKLPSHRRVSRALELIGPDTPFVHLVSIKEVELNEIKQNDMLEPENYDTSSLIIEKTGENYYLLFQDARTDLEELKKLIHEICTCR